MTEEKIEMIIEGVVVLAMSEFAKEVSILEFETNCEKRIGEFLKNKIEPGVTL